MQANPKEARTGNCQLSGQNDLLQLVIESQVCYVLVCLLSNCEPVTSRVHFEYKKEEGALF